MHKIDLPPHFLEDSRNDIVLKPETPKTFPIINEKIPYDKFFIEYISSNQPCLITCDLIEHWKSRRNWTTDEGQINFSHLGELFGSSLVPVADCKKQYYNSQLKSDWTCEKYFKYWEGFRESECPEELPLLYLKDWHMVRSFPDYHAYQTPMYFCSDWLNEYYNVTSQSDDYQFVYMGPKGTWTPLHSDVFSSFSWSANICGRKKWIFFPPGEETHLKDPFGNLPYNYELNMTECEQYDQSGGKCCYEVIQEAGEVVFVPSGWHHQVWNLEDTISINHNWINGANILLTWQAIVDVLSSVEKEISDCKDMEGWHEQCQVVLKSTHGMDFKDFWKFIKTIVVARLQYVNEDKDVSFDGWCLQRNHVIYDIIQLNKVLQLMKCNDVVKLLEIIEDDCDIVEQIQSLSQ